MVHWTPQSGHIVPVVGTPPHPPPGPAPARPHQALPGPPTSHQWCNQQQHEDPVYDDESEDPDDVPSPDNTYKPPAVVLTTLGWLKHLEVPGWQYFEHQYLKFIYTTLTYDWQCIQGVLDLMPCSSG